MILVSACLAGCKCRYDGSDCADEKVCALVKAGKAFPVCPEQLGGMHTPRGPHELVRGADGAERVIGKAGDDTTKEYTEGAQRTLQICKALGVTEAIMKAGSPSCGSGMIYDGSFSGKQIPGDGLTARLLKQNGIMVKTEKEI